MGTSLIMELRTQMEISNTGHSCRQKTSQQNCQWPIRDKPVGCCVFEHDHDAKKPMPFWTSMSNYNPTGTTGNGRCNNGECKRGEVNAETNMFNHLIKIARHTADGFRGEGASKMKNAMPQMWTEELLRHALSRSSNKVVIDLCAGWQSMRPVCEKLGLVYIAVDIVHIKGDRNIRKLVRGSMEAT